MNISTLGCANHLHSSDVNENAQGNSILSIIFLQVLKLMFSYTELKNFPQLYQAKMVREDHLDAILAKHSCIRGAGTCLRWDIKVTFNMVESSLPIILYNPCNKSYS